MPKRWFEKVENKTEFFAKRVAKQSNGKETQSTTRPSSLHCIGRKINYMFEEKGDSRELSVGESSHRPFVFIHKSLVNFYYKGNETGHWHTTVYILFARTPPLFGREHHIDSSYES